MSQKVEQKVSEQEAERKEWLSFNEASAEYGRIRFRIRAIAKQYFEGDETKMRFVRIPVGKGFRSRWEVHRDALDAYFASIKTSDGRKFHMMRVNAEELAAFEKLAKKLGVEIVDRYAHQNKKKA